MNRKTVGAFRAALALVALAMTCASSWAQQNREVAVTRRAVPVAVVRDLPTIKFFEEQYFITEEKIDSMLVIDITDNGFDEKDVLEVYPSKRIINLSESEVALDMMRTWKRTGYIELIGERNKRNQIEVKDPENKFPVAQEFFRGMVRLIEQTYNYEGRKLSLFFEFDDKKGIASLQIWGYKDRREMQEKPKSVNQFAHDLLFFTRTDTVYVDKPVYDVIYIEQTLTDTVYVKGGGE
ncbi:hypothetical protein HUU05_30150 [candidate division KSB1 bacterium]|nr:hypothetical protein [candidate division KSB1 bacterium]